MIAFLGGGIETEPGSSVTFLNRTTQNGANSLPALEYGKYINVQAKREYIRDHHRDQSIVAYKAHHDSPTYLSYTRMMQEGRVVSIDRDCDVSCGCDGDCDGGGGGLPMVVG